MDEQWRAVVGYEGDYEVSDGGIVRRLWKTHVREVRPYHVGRYLIVGLHKGGKRRGRHVHIVVMEAFVGPRPLGYETRHLNGNSSDNRLCNLMYGTPSENRQDMRKHGTLPQGEKIHSAKLKESDVIFIRGVLARRTTVRELANHFGVTDDAIRNTVNGRNWKGVG